LADGRWHRLLGYGVCDAQVVNGGFESGDFTGYTIDTTIPDSSLQRTDSGSRQALLTTIEDATLLLLLLVIGSFLGLGAGSLTGLGNGTAFEGSASNRLLPVVRRRRKIPDFAFQFSLTVEVPPRSRKTILRLFLSTETRTCRQIASVSSSTFHGSSTIFASETGYQSFSFQIPSAGSYTLGLGVVDVTDGSANSGLLVDSVAVSAVPEPTNGRLSRALAF